MLGCYSSRSSTIRAPAPTGWSASTASRDSPCGRLGASTKPRSARCEPDGRPLADAAAGAGVPHYATRPAVGSAPVPDLGVIASLVAVPLAAVTVVFAYLTWREARATVKPLRLMADEQRESLAQQRAQHRLAQLERIGADVAAVHAELVSIGMRGGVVELQDRLRRALTDLRMALQSQPADALPRCRELVRDMRLDLLGKFPADTAMLAVSEVEAALQAAAPG
jgi:hypothetical protein